MRDEGYLSVHARTCGCEAFSECAGELFLYLEAMQTEKVDLYIVHVLLE